jgi:hypothetical protein
MADKVENVSVDLAKLSSEELLNMRNEILRRLATRAADPNLRAAEGYDRHGSGHSRASPPKLTAVDTVA